MEFKIKIIWSLRIIGRTFDFYFFLQVSMVSMKILQLLYSYILEQMNHFPPFPANRGSSRLTGGASLQQGGSNFNVRHMRGDNIKLGLRTKRTGSYFVFLSWPDSFFIFYFFYTYIIHSNSVLPQKCN